MIETTPHPTGSPPDGREDPVRDRGEAFAPWLLNAPFVLLHLAAVAVFFVPVSWGAVLLCANNYFWRMFGITAVYHRYFSHRSYKTSRVFQFLLAWLACSSLQRGPLWWAGHHRIHHLHSDTPQDPHSPYETSFWWAHVGWILSEEHAATTEEIKHEYARYPELAWLDRYHWLPGIVLALACFLAGGWSYLVWGFVVSTILLYHGTFTINSLSHLFGSRRYATKDDSRNNWLLALITLGEGWHNNHHHSQSSANQGFFWWEIDVSYALLKALSWVGLVWDLRKPTEKALAHNLLANVPPRLPTAERIEQVDSGNGEGGCALPPDAEGRRESPAVSDAEAAARR